MTAQSFWKETKLSSVQNLIDKFIAYSIAHDEISELYADDALDFQRSIEIFRSGDAERLARFVYNLDTEPREQLVTAYEKDCGVRFVEDILGFEVL